MLSKYISREFLASLGLLLALMFFVLPAYSQSPPAPASSAPPQSSSGGLTTNLNVLSPQTMLANIQKAVPNLMRMVTAIAYVMGILLVIKGILELKHAGEMRTQMSHEHHMTKPLVMISVGALLIYLPTAVNIGMSTFWSTPNPYGYIVQNDQWQQAINVCYSVIQLIGVIAFIRGLVMLSHVGGGGHHQNPFGKGITHVIGGIFCININQVIQVIAATLGMQSP